MRRRLGESPGALASYGPLIVTLAIAGCVPRPRIRGRSVASSRASVRCRNATPISCGPAFSVSGNSSGPTAAPRPRPPPRPPPRLLHPRSAPLPALPVDRSTGRGIGIRRIGLTGRAPPRPPRPPGATLARSPSTSTSRSWPARRPLHPDDVRAVDGELAPHRDAAARAEWQFVHALVLRMLRIELVNVHHHRHRRIADRPSG